MFLLYYIMRSCISRSRNALIYDIERDNYFYILKSLVIIVKIPREISLWDIFDNFLKINKIRRFSY